MSICNFYIFFVAANAFAPLIQAPTHYHGTIITKYYYNSLYYHKIESIKAINVIYSPNLAEIAIFA